MAFSFNVEQKAILCFLANKNEGNADAVKKELESLTHISKEGEEYETTEDAIVDVLHVLEHASWEEFEQFVRYIHLEENHE